jgi:hypothetical protein
MEIHFKMKHFKSSIIVTVFLLALSFVWGLYHGPNAGIEAAFSALWIAAVLAVMEVSLSFDNAVVNASVLKGWDAFWRKMFLTVGIIVAVFGMRLVFPIVIVAFTADLGMVEVVKLAINNPTEYAAKLTQHHAEIAAFGGAFLSLVGLSFFLDQSKDEHWFEFLESKLALIGTPLAPTLVTLIALVCLADSLPVLLAGIAGIIVYAAVDLLCSLLEGGDEDHSTVGGTVVKAGIGGFLYLEVLDASFSFDGVVGAFAITNDVVIIMIGLAIGAFFVRSITIYLVEKDTLTTLRYLEHGAMYAIVALAVIMLYGTTGHHVPEVITGFIGIAFILGAAFASFRANKKDALAGNTTE